MKRQLLIKCMALALMLLYVLSIGGINVHTCSHTGNVYVTLLAKGVDCQSVHPSTHACCHGTCHHEHHSEKPDDCCHNHSARLVLTGDGDHSSVVHIAQFTPVVTGVIVSAPSVFKCFSHVAWRTLDPIPIPDIIHSICSLRI